MSADEARHILVLDEGTSSTRAVIYGLDGTVLGSCSRDIEQHYPASGLVEHDADEIWGKTLECARAMIALAGGPDRVAAMGITNQRETVVAWDRETGQPLARAIVWQDRRTADRCASLREAGHELCVRRRTGLLLDPYFSATKMAWLLQNNDSVREAGERLAMGTIESWLTWKLTGVHLTDLTNASRTLLLPLAGSDWDDELLDLFGVPRSALPRVVGNAGHFAVTHPDLFGAPIPITGLIGDQQAATVGQACFDFGQTKLTLGTGAFVLTNVGRTVPEAPDRLLGTILYEIEGDRRFALEGSILVAGSLIQWLRDNLGLLGSADEAESLARSVDDSGGVSFLPALAGLGAPYWKPDATAVIAGLTFASGRAHVVRAALEAVSHQVVDLASAFAGAGADWNPLWIDGGMAANSWLAQDLADMTGLEVTRPDDVETTALGAALVAAVGAGIYPDLFGAAEAMIGEGMRFAPRDLGATRTSRLSAWNSLLGAS
jgi:glycerol kinase